MANILIGANVQVGTGQATANMRQFTQTVNREFNSIKTSVNGANNSFNRFERNISQMNHNVTTVFHNMENAVNNWRNSFRTAVANVSTLLGFQLIGSALRNINETLQQTEKSIGALQAITDGVDGAKAKFAELNDLSRTVPQSFDEITQAALTLGKNGLDTSAQSIKALAEIARGTGQSFTSVAQALTSASMGQLRGLKQLGITAVQEGDKIKLTYKGVTETIKADTAELQNYMNKLANSQFADTLKPEMEGVTGATKRVSEAWGDMWRQLGDSGLSKVTIEGLNLVTSALDKFTQMLKSDTISSAINGIGDLFTSVTESIKGLFGDLSDSFLEAMNSMSDSCENAVKAQISSFGNWLSFVGLVIREFIGYVQRAFGAWTSFTSAIGSQMAEITHGTTREVLARSSADNALLTIAKQKGEYEKARAELIRQSGSATVTDRDLVRFLRSGMFAGDIDYKTLYQQNLKQQFDSIKDSNKTFVDKFTDNIEQSNQRINKEINEYYDKVAKGIAASRGHKITTASELTGTTENAPTNLTGGTTIGNDKGGKGGKGGKSSALVWKDTWSAYYQRFLDDQARTLSKSEQIEYQYQKRLLELSKMYAENRNVSEEEYNAVKLAIEKQYLDARKALNQETYDFMQTLNGDGELVRLQTQYQQKLEMLQQYHDQELISETAYQEALAALREEYYKKDSEYQDKKRKAKHDEWAKPYKETADALGQVAAGFQNLTTGLNENSGAYKAAFALQKGFAVASATANAIVAWSSALTTQPFFPAGIAAYSQAIAMTTQILSQLKGVTMHDKGGKIASGALGIVGEYGPELIQGPATVTSRKDTADLLSNAGQSNVQVNLIEDASRAGQVNQRTDDDTQTIIDVIVSNIRNGGAVANAMSGTYGLARQGY